MFYYGNSVIPDGKTLEDEYITGTGLIFFWNRILQSFLRVENPRESESSYGKNVTIESHLISQLCLLYEAEGVWVTQRASTGHL